MPLSNEDNLRLNVLMSQDVKAIRIDEGKMLLYALTAKGEAKVQFNANEKNERYLKLVKDFLSTKVLGVAGGFPVYLSHWNRMGEAKSNDLGKLLLLGEDEATIAVVNSDDLTAEVAEYAWWSYQGADNARSMLSHPKIIESDIAKELAQFLLEFLPFEEDPEKMLISIRLVLQPGLINEDEKQALWKKAKSKNTLYIGFLDSIPNDLPEVYSAHHSFQEIKSELSIVEDKNAFAAKLLLLLSPQGQSFLATAKSAFKRIPNQVVYIALIDSIRRYIAYPIHEHATSLFDQNISINANRELETDIDKFMSACQQYCVSGANETQLQQDFQEVTNINPDLYDILISMITLANMTHALSYPVFSQSTCVGSLMRKKLKFLSDAIILNINKLMV
ncbi:MAG: sulfur reduction protein DsrS [Gammaproteobacteria bacterium]|nr:sulfur reduction protein DsrS [Gammaproteobacteria bacterium]